MHATLARTTSAANARRPATTTTTTTTTRARLVVPPRPARGGAVRVVAFRDAHREARIVEMGRGLIDAWMRGARDGPEAARHDLAALLDERVRFGSHAVVKDKQGAGVDFVADHLAAEHARMEVLGWRVVAAAACSEDDTFFALVEVRYKSRLLGDECAGECVAYKVFEADVLYDDTKLLAMGVHERTQLLPDDVASVASVDSAQRLCSSTKFPEDRVRAYPRGLDNEIVVKNAKAWCQARSSGVDEKTVLDGVLAPGFRMTDAYGVLPIVCNRSRDASECVMAAEAVKEVIAQAKAGAVIKCIQLDAAVSADASVAFQHWRSNVAPKGAGAAPYAIEGVEVDVFDNEGRLLEIFLFRDAMADEKAFLAGRPVAAA